MAAGDKTKGAIRVFALVDSSVEEKTKWVNQYGHPHKSASSMFGRLAQKLYRTNIGQGQSLRTVADGTDVKTYLFKV